MSDKSTIPTNEEIIDELTKDLQQQTVEDTPETPQAKVEDKTPDCVLEDFDNSDESEDESQPPIPNDYIDEEQLKTAEEKLTEDEKEQRRNEAAELKKKGNAAHKEERYLDAIQIYSEALRLCPLVNQNERSILYSNRAASKIQLQYKKSALDDCSKAVQLNPSYVRAYLRRAKLYEETDKLDESLEDYKKVLELDPGQPDAVKATIRLPPLIQERNEKMKTEMLGKLKDLGNMILKPFGLSTNNFQLQQNPNGEGYSINFNQK